MTKQQKALVNAIVYFLLFILTGCVFGLTMAMIMVDLLGSYSLKEQFNFLTENNIAVLLLCILLMVSFAFYNAIRNFQYWKAYERQTNAGVQEIIQPDTWIKAEKDVFPKEACLVIYLNPVADYFDLDITIAYFDNPANYENPNDGRGWVDWKTNDSIMVTHFANLPKIDIELLKTSRKEFLTQFKIELGIVPNAAIKRM